MEIRIAYQIREVRGNLTIAEAAERAGISVSYWSDMERGRTVPTIAMLQKIAASFNHVLVIGLYPVIDPKVLTGENDSDQE